MPVRRFASRFLLVGLLITLAVFVIRAIDGAGNALASITSIEAEGQPERESFRVFDPVHVTIEAAGSFEGGEADTALAAHGWLVHRESGEVVWRMRPVERPARGTYVLMRDTLALAPGTYDAYYAALGAPLARTPRQGTSLRDRLSDALSGGGKGWIGDEARWKFVVALAPGVEEGATAGAMPPEDPEDLVWSTGSVGSNERADVVLRVTEAVQIELDALFEGAGARPVDSAFATTLEGDTVWVARPATSEHAGGSLRNRRQTDTLALAPGQYRVVYHSDGDHAVGSWNANPPWEPWRWGLRIAPADSASRAGAIAPVDPLRDYPRVAEILCVDQPSATHEVRFDVVEALDLTVVAVGEIIGDSAYDFATITRGDETVWDMEEARLRPAGGDRKNRRAEERLSFIPGTYTLRYETDGSHHCGDYNGDAPDDPAFWGVVLLSSDGLPADDRVRILGQSAEVEGQEAPATPQVPATVPENALVDLTGIENSEDRRETFRLTERTAVCVHSLGEISDSNRYDWGRITRPSGEVVYAMTFENSSRAGGNSLNRRSTAFLELDPGSYIAQYTTDGSHAFGSWSNGAPPTPALWGLIVYPAPEGAGEEGDPAAACAELPSPTEPEVVLPSTPPGVPDSTDLTVLSTVASNP